MAAKLEKYVPKPNKGGRKPKLAWHLWFDGNPWRLACGEDIKAKSLKVMCDIIRKTAKRRNIIVSVWKEPAINCVVLQANPVSRRKKPV